MIDFGRRKGDMEKSEYDTDNDGVADNAETLEGSTKAEVQDHTPKAHTHEEADITDLSHDAASIEGIEVDDTDIANGKVLKYNGTSGKLEYETPVSGGGTYVLRGDVDGWDFQIGNFTTDGSAHELDLSAIVPADAIAVNLRLYIIDETAGLFVRFVKNGVTYATNCLVAETKVTGVSQDVFGFIGCDTDRKVNYTTSNTTITAINVYVLGWLI